MAIPANGLTQPTWSTCGRDITTRRREGSCPRTRRGIATLPQTFNPYTYAINNPIRYTDPGGEYIETLIDIGFIGFDIYTIINHWNTGCGDITSDLLALGLDTGRALLPLQQVLRTNGNNNDKGINWGKAITGIGLIIVGGVIFYTGVLATQAALSTLQFELAPYTALIAVAGGGLAGIGVYAVINSGLIPGTKRK